MPVERQNNQEHLIGASCNELIKEILHSNKQIIRIKFKEYFYIHRIMDEDKKDKYDKFFDLTPEEFFLGAELNRRIKSLEADWTIGILSKVVLKDFTEAHIPMMDFKCMPNPKNLQNVKEGLKTIVKEKKGFILETGESYHYYGVKLLSNDEWLDFMGKCLLTNGIRDKEQTEDLVDERYVGYRILARHCCLRITTDKEKTFLPKVVATL